jgi:hypothetical protein
MEHDDLPDEELADLEVPGDRDPDVPGTDPIDTPIIDPVDGDDEFELPDFRLPDGPDPDDGIEAPDLSEVVDDYNDGNAGDPAAPLAEPGAGAPVDLDLEGQIDVGDPGTGGAPGPEDIDLSLDPEADLDADPSVDVGADTDGDGDPDPVDLPLGEEEAFYEVAAGNAWVAGGLIAAGLAAIGASVPALLRLRRATPPDLAAHLDELGIDARVEHLDLTGLEELLRDQRTVLLSTDGSAGVEVDAVLELHAIDRAAGRLTVVDGSGGRSEVPLARFESAWADSANQVVLAAATAGGVALVPVVLGQPDLHALR